MSNLTVVILIALVAALILAAVALARQSTNSALLQAVLSHQARTGTTETRNAETPGAVSPSYFGSRSISVEGTAVRRVAPDLATITLLVKTRTDSPAESQRSNDETQRAVIAAVKAAGVDTKQINPSGLDISEEERTLDDVRIVDYIVQTEVHIETKDLKNVSGVLQQAFAAGATTGRVEFKTSRLRELRDLARKDAIQAAKEKARDLTEGVDATVGKVLSISEGTFGYYAPTQQNSVRDSRQVESSSGLTPDGDGSMEDQFGGGLISISASISASFEMN